MKKTFTFTALLFIALIFVFTSCAPGNEKYMADPAGFWTGIWHGFITLVTFIISLFNDSVYIYEVNNSGWAYNLGFIIGIMIFYGGSSKGTCKWR